MHSFGSHAAAAPRLAAVLIASLLLLLGFTASASALSVCTNSSTSWTGSAGDGLWDDDGNWTAGVPGNGCAVSITAPGTYTVTLTPYNASGDSQSGDNIGSLTLGAGAGSGTQTLDVEGAASVSNSNETNNLTELGIDGVMQINTTGRVVLDATGNGTGNNGPDGGAAELDVAMPSINAGTIVSQVEDTQWKNAILGQLSNSGTLDVDSGTLGFGGSAFTGGAMVIGNPGTFAVASGATVAFNAGDGSSFTDDGTYSNAGATTLAGSMHLLQSGGSETGNPIDFTGGETFEDSAGTGSFEVTNCTTTGLSGTIPANQTITVVGGCAGTTLYLSPGASTPVANHGTIVLDAAAGASDAIIAGAELDNYGTLDSTVGAALPLANQLLVPFANEAGATANLSGGELAQTSGSPTTNAGTVNIGAGATWLVQGGSFANTGTLAPQIASATSVGTMNLTVGSKFTAGGTLAPSLTSGYAPAVGTEFPIVTMNGGGVSGTFGSVTGGFSADYAKETASSPYLGVVYAGASSSGKGNGGGTGNGGEGSTGGTGTTAKAPAVSKVSGGAGRITLKLACAKGKACAKFTIKATDGKKTVATKSGTIRPGKSTIITLKLNEAGAKLLARARRLKLKIVVRAGGRTLRSETVTVTRSARKKR